MTKKTQRLLAKMGTIENDITRIVNRALSTSQTSSIFYSRIQLDFKKSFANAKLIFTEWSETEIVKEYNTKIASELRRINNLSIFQGDRTPIGSTLNRNKIKQPISGVVGESIGTFSTGLDAGEKEMIRLVNYTQQINSTENIGQFIKNQRAMLADRATEGKFIRIINRHGEPMFFGLKDYTDLMVRTKLREASTLGVISTANEIGNDLVQVSSHNTLTPFDMQFEGKIYSLSGKDPDFPAATFLPPFHPRCLHNITNVFKSVLQRRGLQKYVDFSNGKTEEHPTFKSFIPVSKRSVA